MWRLIVKGSTLNATAAIEELGGTVLDSESMRDGLVALDVEGGNEMAWDNWLYTKPLANAKLIHYTDVDPVNCLESQRQEWARMPRDGS
jgi:hypothetical protein